MNKQLSTESVNERSANIHRASTADILTVMNREDMSVAEAVQQKLPEIGKAVDLVTEALKNGGRLFYLGAGTSGRLGVLDASECPPTFNTPKELVNGIIAGGLDALTTAIEGAEDDAQQGEADLKVKDFSKDDVLVGIAASGGTPYVIGGLKYARSLGAKTVSVTCNAGAKISEYADAPIEVVTGAEIISGSTRLKAGTAQKMVLNMLTTASMIKLGKVYKNYMIDVQPTNKKLRRRAVWMLTELTAAGETEAEKALKEADYSVREALVMLEGGTDHPRALECLAASGGDIELAVKKAKGEEG